MDATSTEKLMTELRAVVRDAEALMQTAAAESGEHLREAGDRTREAGSQMEKTADRVRTGTQNAVRQLTDLGVTTEESAAEVGRLRDVAAQVEKFSETIGFVANQTNLLALNATIEAGRERWASAKGSMQVTPGMSIGGYCQ